MRILKLELNQQQCRDREGMYKVVMFKLAIELIREHKTTHVDGGGGSAKTVLLGGVYENMKKAIQQR